MIHENIKYETDEKKADLFAELLSETFKDTGNEKHNEKFKTETNRIVDEFINNEECNEDVEWFNLTNLNKILKNLKSKVSCGADKITNIIFKNLNEKFKIVLEHLCITTAKTLNIPELETSNSKNDTKKN
jgi:deoxyhypusine synthase